MVSQLFCIPLKTSWSSLMRRYFLVQFALIIVCIICYIQIDRHWIWWVYSPEATPLMYCGINVTWLQNLSFSEVYIITDDSSEHITCNDRLLLLHVFERQLMYVYRWWLFFCMYVTLRLSKFSINHYLLTYLLAYLLTYFNSSISKWNFIVKTCDLL